MMAEVRAGSQAEADLMAEARAGSQAEADLMAKARAGSQAEADLMTEATKAEVDWEVDPTIDDPKKGRNLRTARRRRMLWLLGSVLETKRDWAEPPCRQKVNQKEEKSMTLLGTVQWTVLLEVFGRRSKLV